MEVWSCNCLAVEVFEQCELDVVGTGMAGLYWRGIAATEIQSACDLLGIADTDRAQVADDVKHMGSVVAHARNTAAADRSARSSNR